MLGFAKMISEADKPVCPVHKVHVIWAHGPNANCNCRDSPPSFPRTMKCLPADYSDKGYCCAMPVRHLQESFLGLQSSKLPDPAGIAAETWEKPPFTSILPCPKAYRMRTWQIATCARQVKFLQLHSSLASAKALRSMEGTSLSGRACWFTFRGTPQCPMSITENDLGEGHRPLIAILDKVFTHQLNFGDPELSVKALLGGRPLNCAEGALQECIRRFRLGLRESLLQAGLYGLMWHQAFPFAKHSRCSSSHL